MAKKEQDGKKGHKKDKKGKKGNTKKHKSSFQRKLDKKYKEDIRCGKKGGKVPMDTVSKALT